MTLVEVPLLYANYEPFYRKMKYSAIKNSYPIFSLYYGHIIEGITNNSTLHYLLDLKERT